MDVCGVLSVSIVYGVFGVNVCKVHRVCSVYEAYGLVVFCGVQSVCIFMAH